MADTKEAEGDLAPTVANLSTQSDKFATEVVQICDRYSKSADATEFVCGFWDKFVKLQKTYAKGMEELCTSRQAKLTRLFGNESCEHVPELDKAWTTLLDELVSNAKKMEKLGQDIMQQVHEPLTKHFTTEIPKEGSQINMGKKILQDIKTSRTKVASDEKRYQKAFKDDLVYSANEKKTEKEGARLKKEKDDSHEKFNKTLQVYENDHNAAYQQALPQMLKELNDAEVARAQLIKASSLKALELITATSQSVSFPNTNDLYTSFEIPANGFASLPSPVPVIPRFHEPTLEELFAGEPAKLETFKKLQQTTTSSSSDATPAPPTTTETETPAPPSGPDTVIPAKFTTVEKTEDLEETY